MNEKKRKPQWILNQFNLYIKENLGPVLIPNWRALFRAYLLGCLVPMLVEWETNEMTTDYYSECHQMH